MVEQPSGKHRVSGSMDQMMQLLQKHGLRLATAGAPAEVILSAERTLGLGFPPDYRTFVEQWNGAIGPIGEHSFVKLWPIEQLPEQNNRYNVKEFAPGLVLFGSDGSGTAFAFDARTKPATIVEVPFMPLRIKEVRRVARTFSEFLDYVEKWKPE